MRSPPYPAERVDRYGWMTVHPATSDLGDVLPDPANDGPASATIRASSLPLAPISGPSPESWQPFALLGQRAPPRARSQALEGNPRPIGRRRARGFHVLVHDSGRVTPAAHHTPLARKMGSMDRVAWVGAEANLKECQEFVENRFAAEHVTWVLSELGSLPRDGVKTLIIHVGVFRRPKYPRPGSQHGETA